MTNTIQDMISHSEQIDNKIYRNNDHRQQYNKYEQYRT